DWARFHAWWNREITDPAPKCENEWDLFHAPAEHRSAEGNYLLIDAVGKGHVVGVNYYIDNPSVIWYGEGDDMWLIDGEPWPGSLHGTGTEDFFTPAWGPNQLYLHPYFGCARIAQGPWHHGRVHWYRFFLEEPICFEKSIHGSIEHGHAN